MLEYHGHGIAFNLFTISDFLYPKGMNTKGLLEARPDHTIVGPKLAYFAAQNVFAIFDHTLRSNADFEVKTNSPLPLAVFACSKDKTVNNALASAYNEAVLETWLTWDVRLYGSSIGWLVKRM